MSKQQVLMILGVWTAAFLFLGFPSSWDKVFALLTGLVVAGIAYSLRTPAATATASRSSVPFVEHRTEPRENRQEQKSVDGITNPTTL